MNGLKDMNEALDYIEERLDGEIDFRELADIAGVSEYHFRKLFSYLSGMTLSTYIRNRRLSRAAVELRQSEARVLDVAVKYGYDSADGFSRAFREWAGLHPSEVKTGGALKLFPRLTFQLTIRGGMEMDYNIVERDAFKLVGVKGRVPLIFEGINPEIMKIAESITAEQRKKLAAIRNTEVKNVVNASFNFDEGRTEEKGQLDHLIGSITTLEEDFGDFNVLEIPAGTWAVFKTQGPFPKALQDGMAKIFSEWLPSSGYELVDGPEISFNGDMTDPADVYSEIWVPVRKQKK